MAAVVQITDGIDGPVLLDLNAFTASGAGFMLGDRTRIDLAGVTLSTPGEDQAVVWAPASGPAMLASRKIVVPLLARSSDPTGLPDLIRQLHEAIRRPWWLKLLRHGSTVPVWLRCYPTVPQVASNPTATGAVTHTLVTVEAATDPYAYGQRVDVPPGVVAQDPTVPGGFVFDVDGVQGDSLTPVVISTDDRELLGSDTGTLIALRRRGNPAALGPLWMQAETAQLTGLGSAPPTMASFVGDTAFSAQSGVSIQLAAAGGSSSYGQLAFDAPFSGAESPGMYRVLVRARRSGAAAGVQVAFRAVAGPIYLEQVWGAGGSDMRVIDCGVIGVPVGMPSYQASPGRIAGAVSPPLSLLVWRPSTGGGRIDIDWVALVPADEGSAVLWADGVTGPPGTWLSVDGYDHTPRVFTGWPHSPNALAIGQLRSTATRVTGALPMLGPGRNRLYVVGGLSAASNAEWLPGRALAVQVSYWPRWTWLA